MTNWEEIINRGVESKELDYKAPTIWSENDKKACCEIVKDILALANTNGGWLVIGVSEVGTGFSLDGVTEEQAKSFDTTRVNRFVQVYADPPINSHVHKIPLAGKFYVVIEVPSFPATPHVCQKEFPGVLSTCAIYVRTDNNESAPLRVSADFQALIERAVRNRSEQLLTSFRTVLKHGLQPPEPADSEQYEKQIFAAEKRGHEINPHKAKPYAYRETAFYPARFQKERFDLPTLKKMALNACVDFRGWPFIFISNQCPQLTYVIGDGYESFLADPNPFNNGDTLHFWQLRQSGMLYAKEILYEDTLASVRKTEFMVNFDAVATNAGEAVHCLTKLYEGQLDDGDDVVMRFKLAGIKDRQLSSLTGRGFFGLYACRIPEVTYVAQRPFAEWKAGLVDHALAICRHVLMHFNWESPNVGECRKIIEKMFARRL